MKNRIILGSLALDLQRAAIGYYQGSDKIAARFYGEAIERINELDNQSIKPYLRKHIQSVINLKNQKDIRKKAEDALMYSTIVQNYCLKYC
ncbi:MAG: hypothetical protein UU81_C0006G0010 [Microgenomates group bacterium GW2011_GWC1_41_8]|uniref:Uncharacterized protein n=3 Tax=Candidatus Roizmaniibacteriota TaxID=1752723 RepID=A0A0G1A562_9BACT|nr:MAG: hypothetical protein UU14_C0002G0072 [Candidatus Roizmanbacteria bacterium GW2011_GWB1_40_7]KKR92120.1 MAG: hypothetical protein UU41_C0029G0003 [Candidatus Roizmanbacteria bacterium GW2011_GWA1_41_13]KKS20523.1 MAG: hypothetical protein UU78_C0061G0014 [Candidatus Roizmanbacteria bacterium GW2011_GWC2_41_7]KKS24494.1 MAG: hypothetical protein UU81_C0006G0010 [Microgenomates group bacterium GW2011_GWC1_41_8]OGK49711.1 MAG: hypothetical protein A3A55_02855 [Candidatus Roizmanbacteria bac